MSTLKYLSGYAPELQEQVQQMVTDQRLKSYLNKKYRTAHAIRNDAALRDYTFALKNRFMKKAPPISKVIYDNKVHSAHNALGLHSFVSRKQGGNLKRKNEIRIATLFKQLPESLLEMIVVHELAHLKEKAHDKAFYQLCQHILPDYHQREFDTRLWLLMLSLED